MSVNMNSILSTTHSVSGDSTIIEAVAVAVAVAVEGKGTAGVADGSATTFEQTVLGHASRPLVRVVQDSDTTTTTVNDAPIL